MPVFLKADQPDFEERFAELLARSVETSAAADREAAAIIADVRARGADAVVELTQRLDRVAVTATTLAISEAEIDRAAESVGEAEARALELAAHRIRAYHARQMPQDQRWTDEAGVELGWRWTPVDAAGLYVPGGTASYPSSVLMNAIPAKVAGVGRLVVTVPTPDGVLNPLVLLACRLAGVDEVFRVGGAQAIAALAYGAGPIRPVDVVTGPGNAWVAAAKRQVFGHVGIDMVAGPSEVLVIADAAQNPDWVALDLMSQAEHDANAQAILITDDAAFGERVGEAVDALLAKLSRAEIAGASWSDNGGIVVVPDMETAARLADRIAPEHLEIMTTDPDALAARIRHAGAIFLGATTPEAIGDYVGGPNHVLPTARSARFASGLSVMDFLKRTTLARASAAALRAIGPAAETLARSESLEAHALSVRARLGAIQ